MEGRLEQSAAKYVLAAAPVAPTVYFVVRAEAGQRFDLEQSEAFRSVPFETLATLAADTFEDQPQFRNKCTQKTIFLPDWGEPLATNSISVSAALRGATLIFLDLDAGLNFDWGECCKFLSLRIARSVWRNPFFVDRYQILHFAQKGPFRRIADVMELWQHRIAVLGNKSWINRLIGALPIFSVSDEPYHSDRLSGVDFKPDQDLFADYMVFEGARQLPPMHRSLAAVAEKGLGRYCIWNGCCYLSPTQKHRFRKYPYWIVRRSPKLDRLLQIVPEIRNLVSTNANLISTEPRLVSSEENRRRALDRLLLMIRERNALSLPVDLRRGDQIVVSTHGLPPGGAERQWVYLAKQLIEIGFKVTFLVDGLQGSNAHYLPQIQQFGIPIIDINDQPIRDEHSYWLESPAMSEIHQSGIVPNAAHALRLSAAIKKLNPKVLFTQLDGSNLYHGFASLFADVPRVVLSFRNYNPTHFSYLYAPWMLPAYRLLAESNRILFCGNNPEANNDYADWIGIPRQRVALIPNAIDEQMFPPPQQCELDDLRQQLHIDKETPVLLGVFRLSEEKDPITFVEVCAKIKKKIPGFKAFLIGIGPMQDTVETRIASLRLGRTLKLLGRRDDVASMLKLAHVLLLSSIKEGMPNVIMEAQLMGTPIVATASDGTMNTVIPGISAFLRPIGDVQGLADYCISLFENPAMRKVVGAAGMSYATRNFSRQLMVERFLNLVQGHELKFNSEDCSSVRNTGHKAA